MPSQDMGFDSPDSSMYLCKIVVSKKNWLIELLGAIIGKAVIKSYLLYRCSIGRELHAKLIL